MNTPSRRNATLAAFLTAAAMVYLLQHAGMPEWVLAPMLLVTGAAAWVSSWGLRLARAVARWGMGRVRGKPWRVKVGYGLAALAALAFWLAIDFAISLHAMPLTGLTWHGSDAPEQVKGAAIILAMLGGALAAGAAAILSWHRRGKIVHPSR